MTTIAESPADAAAEAEVRTVVFLPSGRDDCLAVTRLSFEDFLRLDLPGPSEWVDGEVRLYMSVSRDHQRIVDFLNRLIGLFIEFRDLGTLTSGPYASRMIGTGPGREPDLVFISRSREGLPLRSHLAGAPDVAIEVVSTDSVARDYVEKFREYEAAGVREYWIIDSRPGMQRADFFALREGTFQPMPLADGAFHSEVIEGFWLREAWLWEEHPQASKALQEVLGQLPLS